MIIKIITVIIVLNEVICIGLSLELTKVNKTRRKYSISSTISREWDVKKLARLRPNLQLSTPSYMEFYYLDNSYNNNKSKNKSIFTNFKTVQTENRDSVKYKITFLRPPLLFGLLRSNGTTCNIPSGKLPFDKNKYVKFTNDIKPLSARSLERSYSTFILFNSKVNNNTYGYKTSSYVSKKGSRNGLSQENNNIEKSIPSISTKKISRKFEYTTAYDRVKFFEIYDSDTYPPPSMPLKHKIDVVEYNRNELNLSTLDNYDVNNCHSHNLTKHAKKHVTFIDRNNNIFKIFNENNVTFTTKIKNQIVTPTIPSVMFSYLSQPASWSNFPFVAVYIYEPVQVRCDCASISSHWLVSSASCLYLHHRDIKTEGISAFVSYCGNNWRHPGRITYVKRSFLHPHFNPLDKIRRQLYNMGIIQVTNSMENTCNGWQPISLMSHQFVADRDGTLATAVGWGLDRYDTRYTISELPLHPLMLYEGHVYSDSCPGNTDYSKAKRLNEESVKNVYCLSLPNYVMEENDTVHGSLLLVGGKLIALYLQEERRPWGEQSAQYTGIWRLIPWLLDVAQETDEQDHLDAEI